MDIERKVEEDYPTLVGYSRPGTIAGVPHHTPVGQEFARAVAELVEARRTIERMRPVVEASEAVYAATCGDIHVGSYTKRLAEAEAAWGEKMREYQE